MTNDLPKNTDWASIKARFLRLAKLYDEGKINLHELGDFCFNVKQLLDKKFRKDKKIATSDVYRLMKQITEIELQIVDMSYHISRLVPNKK